MAETPFPPQVPTVVVYRGDTTTWPSYIFRDDDGALINLSAYSWAGQWRSSTDAATSVSLAVDVSQAASGQITLSATAAQTADMSNGVWDLQSTLAGAVRTWIRGQVLVEKDVTRA